MAKAKSQPAPVVEEPPEKKVNKMAAVREALGAIGQHAKPAELHDWILDNLGHDIDTGIISTYKSVINRKAEGGSGLRGFSLDDIEAVKALAERLGVERLRGLVDVLAR